MYVSQYQYKQCRANLARHHSLCFKIAAALRRLSDYHAMGHTHTSGLLRPQPFSQHSPITSNGGLVWPMYKLPPAAFEMLTVAASVSGDIFCLKKLIR